MHEVFTVTELDLETGESGEGDGWKGEGEAEEGDEEALDADSSVVGVE